MTRTNQQNVAAYRRLAPIYDAVFGPLFARLRRHALGMLALRPGERVLLVGVGTGADLPLLPEGVTAVAVDLSEVMLARARARLPLPGRRVALALADAQALPLADRVFDAALLNLILSVVPDGRVCAAETARVLRAGGRVVIADKFLPEGEQRPNLARRALNWFAQAIGTDINRRLADVLAGSGLAVTGDEPALLGGLYRVVRARKAPA